MIVKWNLYCLEPGCRFSRMELRSKAAVRSTIQDHQHHIESIIVHELRETARAVSDFLVERPKGWVRPAPKHGM